jgi:hypothetical protein
MKSPAKPSASYSYEPTSDYKSMDVEGGKHNLKYADYVPDPNEDENEEEEIYIVRQNFAPMAILFSVAQSIIMAVMIFKCGIAPLRINPMIGPYPVSCLLAYYIVHSQFQL